MSKVPVTSTSKRTEIKVYEFEILSNVNGATVKKYDHLGDGDMGTGSTDYIRATVDATLSTPNPHTLRLTVDYCAWQKKWEQKKSNGDKLLFTAIKDFEIPHPDKKVKNQGYLRETTEETWTPTCLGQRAFYKDRFKGDKKRYDWLPLETKEYASECTPQRWFPASSLYVKIDGPGSELTAKGNLGVKGRLCITYEVETKVTTEMVAGDEPINGSSLVVPEPKAVTPEDCEKERVMRIKLGLQTIPYRPAALVDFSLYNDSTLYPEVIESTREDAAYCLEVKSQELETKQMCVRGAGIDDTIYPGAILLVDNNLAGGSPIPLSGIERGKLSMFGDFFLSDGGIAERTEVEATNRGVHSAINGIASELLRDDNRYTGKINSHSEIFTSKKEMMYHLKVDSNFAGASLKVNVDTSEEQQSFVQANILEQNYFKVKLSDAWHENPGLLFSENVTWEDLERVIKNNGGAALAVVTSVTYGRTFSYLKQYSASKFVYDSSGSVSFRGQELSSSQKITDSSSCDVVDIYDDAGTGAVRDVLQGKKTDEEINAILSKHLEFSPSNQGVVKEYTLQLLTGTNIGQPIAVTYGGNYKRIQYTRCPRMVEAQVNVGDVTILGGKVKLQLDVERFKVENGRKDVVAVVDGDSPERDQKPWFTVLNNSRTVSFGCSGEKGIYIAPNPQLRIRSKVSEAGSYSANDSRRVDVSSGKINIKLKGNVLSSVKIDSVK